MSTYRDEPLVSIVTPFHNTESYLSQCIESVVRQTYRRWEYILVNNCSTDSSPKIAEHYRDQYPDRIRVEHNSSFLSQVQNYNHALRFVCQESSYCKLVQADDWIFPDCVKSMVQVAEAHPAVGIVSAYELEGDEVRLSGLPYPSPEVSGRQVGRLYFLKAKYLFGTPTSLLMRSEVVRSRNPFYQEIYAPFEDGHACFDILRTYNFGFVHQVLTYSRRDNESILSKIRPFGLELLLHFTMLVAHGRDYLSDEEYRNCFELAEREYFRFLSRCACARHPWSKDFWDFHRNGLASVNYTLNRRLLAKWIPRAALEKTWDAFWAVWDKGANNSRERDLRLDEVAP